MNGRLQYLTATCVSLFVLGLFAGRVIAQPNDRIRYNDQDLFLSGGNVAWHDFARDIGPGATNFAAFEEMFKEVHEAGGNSMRLWLHTTGASTPEWNGPEVVGPGEGAIEDLEAILDLAWKYEVGVMPTLWSFDMLRIANGAIVTDRARGILTDSTLTQTYIDNALIPMVEALVDHPALIAWEIFNEPEGMSNEFGWDFNHHVAMRDIQRFVNLTAGAIHRADPEALVTNGAWSFMALSDNVPGPDRRNYYSDERLIEAGGDSLGTLDFYTVHYYTWAGTELSPFHHDYEHWGLDKPLVVAEFFLPDDTFGVSYQDMYTELFERGYAGAMAWQWVDWFQNRGNGQDAHNWPRALENMRTMWDQHREDVDIVFEGVRINYFEAVPDEIETGGASELRWEVSGATSVSLNGTPVDPAGTLSVIPSETTTYTLLATDPENNTLSEEVTVQVFSPEELNRAKNRPVTTSSNETCCGNQNPERAVDGDLNTRWSSEWEDDQWIQVDLGALYDVSRVVLLWESAHASEYDIDVSTNGRDWTTVFEERNGNGETDEWIAGEPVPARYVRMHGLVRATEWGFSLWEFRVHGLPSAQQLARYESEDADLTGETTIRSDLPGAGGGQYVDMRDTGTITWKSVSVPAAGDYTLAIYYYLPFDEKKQFIAVNGDTLGEYDFDGPLQTWLTLEIPATLQQGANEVSIIKSWGWMNFDYIEVRAGSPVAVDDPGVLPERFVLGDNYPNPFNPSTVIPFVLAEPGHTSLEIFDLTGRRVAVLLNQRLAAGSFSVPFDAGTLASGVYMYRLQSGSFVESKRMVLLK